MCPRCAVVFYNNSNILPSKKKKTPGYATRSSRGFEVSASDSQIPLAAIIKIKKKTDLSTTYHDTRRIRIERHYALTPSVHAQLVMVIQMGCKSVAHLNSPRKTCKC